MSLHQGDGGCLRPVARPASRRQGRAAAGAAHRVPGSAEAVGFRRTGIRRGDRRQRIDRLSRLAGGRLLYRRALIWTATARRAEGCSAGKPIASGRKLPGARAAGAARPCRLAASPNPAGPLSSLLIAFGLMMPSRASPVNALTLRATTEIGSVIVFLVSS